MAYQRKLLNLPSKFNTIIKTLPYGMEEGEVIDIQVVCHPKVTEDGIPEFRDYYIEDFENSNKRISDFLNNSIVRKTEVSIDLDYRVRVVIKFRYTLFAGVGTKISNRFGSKGSVTKVIPDELAPRIGGKDGPIVDILINPKASKNRKNPATDVETILGYVSKEAFIKGKQLISQKKFGEYSHMLNLIHVTDEWTKASEEELINYHKSQKDYYQLIVTAMDKKYTKDKVIEICNYFNIDLFGEYLYYPEWDELTENKIQVGITNIMRLHFIEMDKMKATGEIYTGDELILGSGSYRVGGQRLGEMENWAFKAHNSLELIDDLSGKSFQKLTLPQLEMNYLSLGLMIQRDETE